MKRIEAGWRRLGRWSRAALVLALLLSVGNGAWRLFADGGLEGGAPSSLVVLPLAGVLILWRLGGAEAERDEDDDGRA